ncbi:MAG: cell division protein ZapA [Lachnospiraceae bacterium]|jgi:cell division protein ZapA|nr:cell division protein ZapA [Lachnospiraceae bacterium]
MAAPKTDTKVVIGGKVYTLSGYESEEYIQKVASYLNGKLEEFQKEEGYSHLSIDLRNLLLNINISDDYFKARKQIEGFEEDMKARDKDLYDIKHELVTTQMKLEASEKTQKRLQTDNEAKDRRIIELEAELKNHR